MRTHFRPFTCFAGCVLLTAAIALPAGAEPGPGPIKIVDGVPPGFEVVRVTNEPVRSTIPEINERSEVVWGTIDGDVYKIHRFANGLVETLTDGTTVDSWPTNNDESEIAWIRCPLLFPTPCRVAASFSPDPIDGGFFPIGSVSMNTVGDVVWAHELPADPDCQEIVLFDRARGSAQVVTDVGLQNSSPRINDQKQITWTRYDFTVSPWQSTIMFWSDGVVTPVSSGTTAAQGPDLNNRGQVIWEDLVDIFLWDGTKTTNVTENIGPAGQPRINDAGDIYFGLWNYELGKWDAVLLTGETLYRLPDFGLSNAQGSLNDRGELAWRGGLDPGANSNILLLRGVGPKGDMNHDCHVDMVDLRVFQICHTGANNGPPDGLLAQCTRADFDGDADVDVDDFESFSNAQFGPAVFIANCEP